MSKHLLTLLVSLVTFNGYAQQLSSETKKFKAAKVKSITIWNLEINDSYSDTLRYRVVQSYNNKGESVTEMRYNKDGTQGITYTRSFDRIGNEVKKTGRTTLGKITYLRTYSYDKTGRIVSQTNCMATQDTSDDVKFHYTYVINGKHQIISRFELSYGDTISKTYYKYDSVGNQIEQLLFACYRGGCTPNAKYIMAYDSSGLLIEKRSFYYDHLGEHASYTEQYQYDKNQLLTKVTVLGSTGRVKEVQFYNYEYY